MPGIDYQRLRPKLHMRQVLELIAFQATWQRGLQLRGRCPIPGCRSASGRSFSVHLTRQIYHCFACRSGGNALDLWAAVHSLSIHQAALDLCRLTNLDPPWLNTVSRISIPRPSSQVPFPAPSRNL